MKVERGHDWRGGSGYRAHALEDVGITVAVDFGDHRAVKSQQNAIERRGHLDGLTQGVDQR